MTDTESRPEEHDMSNIEHRYDPNEPLLKRAAEAVEPLDDEGGCDCQQVPCAHRSQAEPEHNCDRCKTNPATGFFVLNGGTHDEGWWWLCRACLDDVPRWNGHGPAIPANPDCTIKDPWQAVDDALRPYLTCDRNNHQPRSCPAVVAVMHALGLDR